jgi:hypothetical protein
MKHGYLSGFIALLLLVATSFAYARGCCSVVFTDQDYPPEASHLHRELISEDNGPFPFSRISYNINLGNFFINVRIESYADEQAAAAIFDEDMQWLANSDWSPMSVAAEDFSGFYGFHLRHDDKLVHFMEFRYSACAIIRIRTEYIGAPGATGQLNTDEIWAAREQTLNLLSEKCPELRVSRSPFYVGKYEFCYLSVSGGTPPYRVSGRANSKVALVLPSRAKTYTPGSEGSSATYVFGVWGDAIGETLLEISDDPVPELNVRVPINVIEAMYPSIRANGVLYLPYVKYRGNTYQALLSPIELESSVFEIVHAAIREEYKGCGNIPVLDETTLDLYVPCMLHNNSFWTYTMRWHTSSIDPLRFYVDTATLEQIKPITEEDDFRQCFPGSFAVAPVLPNEFLGR